MNPLPPNTDELVSAYLDGEAAPDEVAIVESSSELMARVESMRAVSNQTAIPPTPPPAQKEAHLAAALDAFDILFASGDAAETTPPAQPALAAVPDQAAATTTAADTAAANTALSPEQTPTVTSLETARARRRPRRFNTGVIAAAAAAVLLFVGLTALSLGRGGNSPNDVATASSDAAEAVVEASGSDEASDAADTFAEEEAMDDEEAMADSDEESRGGLSEAQAAAPAPTAAPPEAASAADAVEEEAMEDEEEAMAEEVEADADALGSVDDAGDRTTLNFFVGEFNDPAALRLELDRLSIDDLVLRADELGEGLFPRCQADVPELAEVDMVTFIGEAIVGGELVEVHLVREERIERVYLVSPDECALISIEPAGG